MRRLLLIAAPVVLLLFAAPIANAGAKPAPPGPGNSTAARACQNGGWQNLVTSTGASFANQDQCVSYAANGGVLAPKPTATLTITQGPDVGGVCQETVTGTGLQPGSDVTYTVVGVGDIVTAPVPAADGTFSESGFNLLQGESMYATATRADGTTITSNTVTC